MMMNDVDEKIVTMEDGDGDNEANLGWLYRVAQLKWGQLTFLLVILFW